MHELDNVNVLQHLDIVHTVGSTQSDILERCYKSCLEQMKLKKMKSLVSP